MKKPSKERVRHKDSCVCHKCWKDYMNPKTTEYSYPDDFINKVIRGDCLEVMKKIPDESIDLVLTDPPYGMNLDTDFSGMVSKPGGYKGKIKGNKYEKVIGDVKFDFTPYWEELTRVSNKFVVFGVDYFMSNKLLNEGSLSVWDKRLTESADKMFGSCFETIWFYPKKKRKIYRYKWAGIFGMENEKFKKRLHPTQKPERLIAMLVDENSNKGDIVLDPFLGSGTTAVASKERGRNFIGIEISPEYCKVAEDRLRQGVLLT